eukprot:1159143-Pelagomonas_calceolata.AAC.4
MQCSKVQLPAYMRPARQWCKHQVHGLKRCHDIGRTITHTFKSWKAAGRAGWTGNKQTKHRFF